MATNVATLLVTITTDTKGMISGLNAGALAIGAFAGAAVKSAIDYDQAFTRIAAVSNASADQVARWRDEVLTLSGETARAPQELADALYFLASAGLAADQIMPALEASAKGAAVGLGETADVARIVAQVLNAYAGAGMEAADVTDVLVAAVREGTAAPEEFAGALGRVLPIASQAGVSFDQVAASLSSLSNIGLDVDEGVTALRGTLQAIVAPGSAAAEAMRSIGLSAQELLNAISERGLFGALQLLDRAAKANTDTQAEYIGVLRQVVPNVRALTGVLGLTQQQASKVNAIFKSVKDSSGDLGEAFKTTAESDAFRMQRALNNLRIALVRVGGDALPKLASAFEAISPLIEAAAQNLDVLIGILAAFKVGSIAAAAGAASFGAALGPIGLLLGGLIIAGRQVQEQLAFLGTDFKDLANGLEGQLFPALEQGILTYDQYAAALEAVRSGEFDQAGALLVARDAIDSAVEAQAREIAMKQASQRAVDQYVGSLQAQAGATNGVAGATEHAAHAVQSFAGLTGDALKQFKTDVQASMQVAVGQFEKVGDAFKVTPEQARKQLGTAVAIARRFHQDTEAILSADLTPAVKKSLLGLPPAIRDAWVRGDAEQRAGIEKLAKQLDRLNQQEVKLKVKTEGDDKARHNLQETADKANRLVDDGPYKPKVDAQTSQANGAIDAVQNNIAHLVEGSPYDVTIQLHTHASPESIPHFLARMQKQIEHITSEDWTIVIRALDTGMADQLSSYLRDLKDLENTFSKLRDRVVQFRQTIRGALDVDVIGALQQALSDYNQALANGEDAMAPDLGAIIAQQAQQASDFAQALVDLQKAGLSQRNLADLAAKGVSALPLAQALLASPELISQLNQAADTIAEVTGQTVDKLVDRVFGHAVDRLAERMDRLQERFANFAEHLQVKGKDVIDALDRLRRMLDNLTGGGGGGATGGGGAPGSAFGNSNAGPGGGGPSVVVNVQGWVGDDQDIARRVRDELVLLARKNGGSAGIP